MINRSERLSFFMTRGIQNVGQIKDKIVSSVYIDSHDRLVIEYNDSEKVLISRKQGTSPDSVHVVSVQTNEQDDTVTLTDSSGTQYVIGSVFVEEEPTSGTGVYTGLQGNKHVFKPLVFDDNFQEIDGLYRTTLGSMPGSLSDKRSTYASGFNNYSIARNSWRNRSFDALVSNIPQVALVTGRVFVPEGRYLVRFKSGTWQTSWGVSRLESLQRGELLYGTVYSSVGASATETQSIGSGIIDVIEGGENLIVQSYVSTARNPMGWSFHFLQLWRLE